MVHIESKVKSQLATKFSVEKDVKRLLSRRILEIQLVTRFAIWNDYRADFREILFVF